MCWADRATLILGLLYGGFMFLLLGPQNPYVFSGLWWYGMAWLVGLPIVVLWVVLRLALGNKGAIYRERPLRPGFLRDANGNPIRPLRPDTSGGTIINH